MNELTDKDDYRSSLKFVVKSMRGEVDNSGYRFFPSFEKCVEIARKEYVRKGGKIMPAEEAAYYVLLSALEDLHGSDWVNKRFGR